MKTGDLRPLVAVVLLSFALTVVIVFGYVVSVGREDIGWTGKINVRPVTTSASLLGEILEEEEKKQTELLKQILEKKE